MKLYFTPGACSLSPHIAIRELGLDVEFEAVNLGTKVTATGENFKSANPKGYVPALLLDNGELLTEGAVIVQLLADLKPEAGLIPKPGTLERYRVQEWLNFIATELHKGFSPLYNPKCPDEWKTVVHANLIARFGIVEERLSKGDYLMGEKFTVADAYLYTILTWAPWVKLDLSSFTHIPAFVARVAARPAVQSTHAFEKAAR